MKNMDLLKKKLDKNGFDLIFEKYQYWNSVLCAKNRENGNITFLVWDIYDKFGGVSIISCLNDNTTFDYILECLNNETENLGLYDYRKNGFGVKHKFLYYEIEN